MHKTRANARFSTARQPLQTPPPPADGAALRRSPAQEDVQRILCLDGKAVRQTQGRRTASRSLPDAKNDSRQIGCSRLRYGRRLPASALRRLRVPQGWSELAKGDLGIDDRALCRSRLSERAARRTPRLQYQPSTNSSSAASSSSQQQQGPPPAAAADSTAAASSRKTRSEGDRV